MDWIDQNLDAYRVIAEILTDLRPLVRERIESKHGKEWFRDGIPDEVFERLIRNKEQEASIDWYENRYQEVISYAVFPDLFEIIIRNAGLFTPILRLAPSQSLLNTRFLELEVMRSKIGRARQVSESEINFLTSFHLRFRKAVQELQGMPVDASTPLRDPSAPETGAEKSAARRPDERPAEPEIEPDQSKEAAPSGGPGRPPQRLASSSAAAETSDPAATIEIDEPDEEPPKTKDEAAENGQEKVRETAATIVKRAMEKNDHSGVLREIYREVTGIAEVIWTTEEIPTTAIWDRVSTNQWYEKNFSKLELRPLSDFYELISQVRTKRKAGASKAEIQSFLNDSKFATVLLALRDMFQKNQI
jgi:hypothetical protein